LGASCSFDTGGISGGSADVCGNGVKEGDEACDGADLGAESCESLGLSAGELGCNDSCELDTSSCGPPETCGNGVVDGEGGLEECDGGDLGGQSCESLGYVGGGTLGCTDMCRFDASGCSSETCGNGIREGDESCDGQDLGGQTCQGLGYSGGALSCAGDCTFELSGCESAGTCGDGVVDEGEVCDDGGATAECDADCTLPECGDGVTNELAGEECDGGGQATQGCDADCTYAECGDGVHNGTAGEECDEGGQTATCDGDCTAVWCGDGTLNEMAGEECDEGNANSNTEPDACRTDCTEPVCGDGVVDPGNNEACDDGAANSDTTPDACRTDCTEPVCGDGVVDPGNNEACDDGAANSDATPDACRTDCTEPVCGDGVVDPSYGEECDTTNLAGESCSSQGFSSGDLACTAMCGFDTTQCVLLGEVGDPCQAAADCASNECLAESSYGWPRGHCTESCDPVQGCDGGNLCLLISGTTYRCFDPCSSSSECRDGYSCFPFRGETVCWPNCDADSQCDGAQCERYIGRCEPPVTGSVNGAACAGDGECRGYCIEEDGTTGVPHEGYCMSSCSLSKDNCPDGDVCVDFGLPGDLGQCLADCANASQCRLPEYTCGIPPWDPPVTEQVCYDPI
jgi:hypothetical protein